MVQIKGTSNKQRLLNLLETGIYSDCEIITDDATLKGHKMVLAAASSVFENQFYGPFHQNNYHVPFSSSIMTQVLRAAYQQTVAITSKEEALDLMAAADMFKLNELRNIANSYLSRNKT